MPSNDPEFQESNPIVLEWRLQDLRNLFEASKGETKSKVTKSAMFGGGRWQVLFYANAGNGNASDASSGHISLFLSCEPTEEEKEVALNGRWIREGVFKFTFEVHDLGKAINFNTKEAQNHTFSWKTANWGWAQFCKRDSVYYHRPAVKSADALLITCTISGRPEPPAPAPAIPRQLVPRDLLDAVGGLLDDPHYSDMEFILSRRGPGLRRVRRIYAMKNLLKRAEYFDHMFNGGFAEASTSLMEQDDVPMSEVGSEAGYFSTRADDSDEEDEYQSDADSENDGDAISVADPATSISRQASIDGDLLPPVDSSTSSVEGHSPTPSRGHTAQTTQFRPSLPSGSHLPPPTIFQSLEDASAPSRKLRVIVKDVAYSTYRAVLYYLYTDTIRFAPLSSSFYATAAKPQSATQQLNSDRAGQATGDIYMNHQPNISSRREFITTWAQTNPGRPVPCSAKAVYRLADKLGLRELKERAFEHIIKSLTVENVPYEVFSVFSATFEAVRKVEVKFFLDHWTDIRSSDAMQSVWQQIRLGRHPGFEEVWPAIATNLEFNPQAASVSPEGHTP